MKEDELILSTFKLNVHKQSRTAAVKWLAEIAHSNPAWMNPETAAKLGVKTGDLVRVESAVGHLVTKAYVTEGIHPKVVAIPTGFGHWEYGRLATLRLKDKKGEASHGQDDPDLNNVWWDDKGVHPEQHHSGRCRSHRRFARLVRHRRQGDQGRPERQVRR